MIKQALKENDFLIIGIGSAQYAKTEDNPFSVKERQKMIISALDEISVPHDRYALIPIPDIHDNARWVDHVINLVPPFDRIYTGSPIVKKLFTDHKKFPIIDVKFLPNLSATAIRKKMKEGKRWEKDVPSAVINHLRS
mgnify:FL=1